LTAAVGPREEALRLNSEETGTLVLLGLFELARGNLAAAQSRFVQACQANPRARVGLVSARLHCLEAA